MLHNITFCVLLYKQTESMFNMKEQEKNILEKYIQGSINELEYNELKQIVITGEDKKLLEMIDTCYHKDTNIYTISSFTKETLRNEIWQQIKKANYRKRIQKFAALAATILLPIFIFSTTYFYFQADKYKQKPNITTSNNGQKAEFTLPDGTSVHLNSGSKLSYNSEYNGNVREVTLEGEAFFDVIPNKDKPFIVKTSVFNIEVLGTSFNVSIYNDENIAETTLIEGKVKLTLNDAQSQPIYLTPSQKFVYSKSNKKGNIYLTDEEYELAWKNGILIFKAESLEEVFHKMERWYGVTIHYDKNNIINDQFTGKFKALTIQEMMNILRMHYNLKYKIENNNIYII